MPDPKLPDPATRLPDVLQDALRKLVADSRERLLRAADDGRVLLRVRQLQRDRDALWGRLGKTAYRLVQSDEIDHPALRKAMSLVDDLDDEIRRLRDELGDDDTLEP